MSDEQLEAVITAVKQSAKYGDTAETTIRELSIEALRQHKKVKSAVKAVRTRLHSIMAPYLGDPVYDQAAQELTAVFATHNDDQIRATCWKILGDHLSTRERLPLLPQFYGRIFAVTGQPQNILDIACGLNPLAFRWMNLEKPVQFYAYDIHEPRIHFINHYFALEGLPQLATVQDVAITFPQETADLALFLKEMPRFERNYHGLGRPLLEALRVKWLVLSFPTVSTHGGRSLTNRYRTFMTELIAGKKWPMTEILFEGELLFCIQKET